MTLAEARPAAGIAAALLGAQAGERITAVTADAPVLHPAALVAAALTQGLEVAVWLRPTDELAIVGVGRAWAVEPSGSRRFAEAGAAWAALGTDLAAADRPGAAGPVLLGGLGFAGERTADGAPWEPFPVASLVLPALGYVIQGGVASLTVAVASGSEADRGPELEATWDGLASAGQSGRSSRGPERVARARSTPDRAGWERLVGLMAGAVGRGRLDKVVLARRVDLEMAAPADVAEALARLVAGAPECATFLFARDGRAFLGATPERLARVDGRAFRTAAIAGSTKRGRDSQEDATLAAALLSSDKDREEHAVVVETLRAELTPIAAELHVAPAPGVLPLRDLQHLVTPIDGALKERVGLLSLGGLLHPTPAVGGAPTAAALAMLAEHEGFDRGWYAGPVGWLGPDGDGELMVALRCGVIDGSQATLFAGCGIVADSVPGQEWLESRMKLRPMLAALGLDPDEAEAGA